MGAGHPAVPGPALEDTAVIIDPAAAALHFLASYLWQLSPSSAPAAAEGLSSRPASSEQALVAETTLATYWQQSADQSSSSLYSAMIAGSAHENVMPGSAGHPVGPGSPADGDTPPGSAGHPAGPESITMSPVPSSMPSLQSSSREDLPGSRASVAVNMLATVPIITYDGRDDFCTICLEKYVRHDQVCRMPCKHMLHAACWQKHVLEFEPSRHVLEPCCPICRGPGVLIASWPYVKTPPSTPPPPTTDATAGSEAGHPVATPVHAHIWWRAPGSLYPTMVHP